MNAEISRWRRGSGRVDDSIRLSTVVGEGKTRGTLGVPGPPEVVYQSWERAQLLGALPGGGHQLCALADQARHHGSARHRATLLASLAHKAGVALTQSVRALPDAR